MPERFFLPAEIVDLLEARAPDEMSGLPSPAEGLALISAFTRIKDPERRKVILGLVRKAAQH